MPPYPLPDTDPAYTMQPGSFDPQGAVPQQMDPAAMSQLFGDGESQPGDQTAEEADGQDTDQAQGPPDQGKLQDVMSDPGLLMSVAQVLKTLGTGDDTDLVHVTDREKQILKQAGGKGTVNPTTGLLQYASSGAPEDLPSTPDWINMHPDDRVAHIGSMYQSPPGWSRNWWAQPVGAPQGGFTRNISPQNFASMNAAITPSIGTALSFGSMIAGLGMNPIGLIGKMAMSQLGKAVGLGGGPLSSFDTPGGMLSQDAQNRVAAAMQDAMDRNLPAGQVMNAADRQLSSERAAAESARGGQYGGAGPDKSAGIGVDQGGQSYGSNIGGAGVSHNEAAARQAAAAAGNVDKGSGTAGGGGGAGGDASNGGDRGGGLGGGVGHDGARSSD